MPPGFTKLYAERLNRICAMKVTEAVDGDVVEPGHVYVAPGDCQMALTKVGSLYKLQCRGTERISGHCPSVDNLFKSVAEVSTKHNVGIILTGMGRDGAEGLLEMKKKGAYTLGENQESCVVYGMPMVAQNIGAVTVQSTNREIPNLLMKHLNSLG
ncbi:MAG: CheB methylesterase domain-containing protein [Anaerovoracaceae bacterium]